MVARFWQWKGSVDLLIFFFHFQRRYELLIRFLLSRESPFSGGYLLARRRPCRPHQPPVLPHSHCGRIFGIRTGLLRLRFWPETARPLKIPVGPCRFIHQCVNAVLWFLTGRYIYSLLLSSHSVLSELLAPKGNNNPPRLDYGSYLLIILKHI